MVDLFEDACVGGDVETVKGLIKGKHRREINGALILASVFGNLPVVKYFCEDFPPGTLNGVNLAVEEHDPLRGSAWHGCDHIVKYLVSVYFKHGIEVPEDIQNDFLEVSFAVEQEMKKKSCRQ